MNIPPKYSKVFTVESSASDPHLGGPLEVRLSADGVSIRWAGETVWKEIEWYEIAICAEAPGQYREIIDQWKVDAFEEGLEDGLRTSSKETDVLSYAEELKELRDREKEQYTPSKPPPRNAG